MCLVCNLLPLTSFAREGSGGNLDDDLESDRPLPTAQLQKIEKSDGLKILWWNTHQGVTYFGQEDSSFSDNVSRLIQSKELAPDIIAMGEYSGKALRPDILKAVQAAYPYSVTQPYPDKSGAIAVFSRYSIQVTSLDILPGDRSADSRPEMVLNVKAQGKNFTLVPIHIYDSWRRYQAQHGRIMTAAEIVAGEKNPVAEQIGQFTSVLKAHLGAQYQKSDTIIVGDFNQPSSIYGIPTREYFRLRKGWKDATPGDGPSFPAKNSVEARSYPMMQIDHALVSKKMQVEAAAVLPLKGSDHYPLYLVVKPGQPGLASGSLSQSLGHEGVALLKKMGSLANVLSRELGTQWAEPCTP